MIEPGAYTEGKMNIWQLDRTVQIRGIRGPNTVTLTAGDIDFRNCPDIAIWDIDVVCNKMTIQRSTNLTNLNSSFTCNNGLDIAYTASLTLMRSDGSADHPSVATTNGIINEGILYIEDNGVTLENTAGPDPSGVVLHNYGVLINNDATLSC